MNSVALLKTFSEQNPEVAALVAELDLVPLPLYAGDDLPPFDYYIEPDFSAERAAWLGLREYVPPVCSVRPRFKSLREYTPFVLCDTQLKLFYYWKNTDSYEINC